MNKPLIIYVDVDETFVRNYGVKRIAMPNMIKHIQELKNQGAIIYCWSSGGSEYAKKSAIEFGIEDCFEGFLPKPEVLIDDLSFFKWRNLLEIHPNECDGKTIEYYREKLNENKAKS